MPQTVEVRFKGIRRDFFLWPDDREPLRPREAVVVQAERGQDLGHVASTDATAEKKCGGCSGCSTVGRFDGSTSAEQTNADVAGDVSEIDGAAPTAEPPNRPTAETAAEPPSRRADEPPAEPPSRRAAELRAVLRRASPEEIRAAEALRRSEEDARRQAIEKARQHRLDMKVSDAEWQWDRGKLTLYFTAEKRVDFRALVRDLAAAFRTRIELRQIGVRDEAARLSGVGRCGREYCCSSWLKELSPVSLALAKDQHLSLNPAQISGGCGRLLCCLKYEHEFYVAARKRFPREGKTVTASRGVEKVIAVDIFRERVFLRNEEGSRIIPLVQLREEEAAAGRAGGSAVAEDDGSAVGEGGSAVRRLGGSTAAETRRGQTPEPTNPRTAQPPNRTAEPANPPAEPPNPTAEPPKKRRRRRGRRRRGPQGGPPSPPGPPEA
jgi:cell fate regulator YaaT (PSP1 superfamily)